MDSKLQIISGRFRGRKLFLPVGARPTQNRARIALFNMLGGGLCDMLGPNLVWDAFAGSGAFGIEFLSRYPTASVIFTDVAPASINTIKRNLSMLGDVNATVIQADAMSRIGELGARADIIFLDPPYAEHTTGAAFVRKVGGVAKVGTILIWEQDGANPYAPDENVWEILRDKRYGRARFLILAKK